VTAPLQKDQLLYKVFLNKHIEISMTDEFTSDKTDKSNMNTQIKNNHSRYSVNWKGDDFLENHLSQT